MIDSIRLQLHIQSNYLFSSFFEAANNADIARFPCCRASMSDAAGFTAQNGALINQNGGMYLPGRAHSFLKKLEVACITFSCASGIYD